MTPRLRAGSSSPVARLAALGLAALLAVTALPGTIAAFSGTFGSPSVTVERLGGATPIDVAVATSRRQFPAGGAPIVFLAAAPSYRLALTAGAAAAHLGGAVLYTNTTSLPGAVAAELTRLAPSRIEIAGDSSAVADAVLAQVAAAAPGATVERLRTDGPTPVAASDAPSIAAAISRLAYRPRGEVVFLASDGDAAGSVLAGYAASATGAPFLLLDPNAMPAATVAELARLEPQRAIVVGGSDAVSDGMLAELKQRGLQVERVAGDSGYATAELLADRYSPAATTLVVVPGPDYASGIVATPMAKSRGAPFVYTPSDDVLPYVVRDRVIATHATRLVVAGTTVSDVMLAQLVGYSDGRLDAQPSTPTYPSYDSGYHDPGELLTLLRAAEIAYPTRVRIFSIGKSYEGRDIWAAKVSDNVSAEEGEPEALVDALHHADEHLGVEQALYLFRVLTDEYTTDPYVHRLVDERVTWIVFALNPDGWAYDLSGGKYHFWRKNRQPYNGYYGTDLNRNYGYKWACCNGSSGNPWAWNFRGPEPWSAPETRALRNLVMSRVLAGKQMIKTHVTLHVNDEYILYPAAWTRDTTPPDVTADDLATFEKMAYRMSKMNGYRPMQSSHMYVTDGDQIDWLYGTYGIFSFTWELYPVEQAHLTADVYPPYSVVPAQTARNRTALLYLIDAAACPYAAAGLEATHCGAVPAVSPPASPPAI